MTANKPAQLTPPLGCWGSGVALCGTFAGQLVFGYLGDRLGRKKVYGITLIIMIVSSICSGLSFSHSPKAVIGYGCCVVVTMTTCTTSLAPSPLLLLLAPLLLPAGGCRHTILSARRRRATTRTLCFFRFFLGFGVGGEYPLCATIMSEYSNSRNRGAFVAAVFAMQARLPSWPPVGGVGSAAHARRRC